MRTIISLIILSLFLALPVEATPCESCKIKKKDHVLLNKKEMQWMAAPAALPPGAKISILHGNPKAPGFFAMRIEAPGGYTIPPHWHPADEHVTVISGTFNMGIGSQMDKTKGKALPAGSFAMMKKGTRHFAWTKGKTVVQVHAMGPWGINYVNPADDPRKIEEEI
ncbi:MAG: cupin domain-containing protein [Deltaproteobacteria bacterium]|nr:cupin domain-containing protein [Deltaproteobacteria bacterium]